MAEVQRRIDQKTLKPGRVAQLQEKDYFHNRHLDNRCIYELLNHPSLVEKAARILGGHLVWWRTNFQLKLPLAEQDDWDTEIYPGIKTVPITSLHLTLFSCLD